MFDDLLLRLIHLEPREHCVSILASARRDPLRCVLHQSSITTDHRTRWQLEFAPPDDVGEVTERADHGDAGSFVDLCKFVSTHWNFDTEERGLDGFAEERLISGVIGMRDERDARGNEFGSSGCNHHVT